MSKIFSLPLYKGTLLEENGNTINKSGINKLVQLGKGFGVDFTSTNYLYSTGYNSNAYTVVWEFYLKERGTASSTINLLGNFKSGALFNIGDSTGSWTGETFTWWSSSGSDGGYIKDEVPAGHNQVIMRWNETDSKYDVWLNGKKCVVYSDPLNPNPAVLPVEHVYIGKRDVYVQYFNDYITNLEIYDNIISDKELSNLINSFLKRSYINYNKKNIGHIEPAFETNNTLNNYIDTGINLSGSQGFTIKCFIKKEHPSNIAAINQTTDADNRLIITTHNDGYIYFGVANGGNAWGRYEFDGIGWNEYVFIYDGSGATNEDKIKIYINGELQTLTFSGTIASSMPTIASNLMIGHFYSSTYTKGLYSDFKLWTSTLTYEETKTTTPNYNFKLNEGKGQNVYDSVNNNFKTITNGAIWGDRIKGDYYLNYDFNGNSVRNKNPFPDDFNKVSGSYEIDELSSDDAVLSHLKKGAKYLICNSSGYFNILCDKAYGIWEFDIYNISLNNLAINFINDTGKDYASGFNGYQLSINGQQLRLFKINDSVTYNILFTTSTTYIEYLKWYRLKVIRKPSGEFSVYIKGGNFGDSWTLVTTSTGTNPVTDITYMSGKFINIDIDNGTRLGNITFRRNSE